ncbi:MAG: hypothetical protein AAF772_05100 [Acidobacteriota bacterium]
MNPSPSAHHTVARHRLRAPSARLLNRLCAPLPILGLVLAILSIGIAGCAPGAVPLDADAVAPASSTTASSTAAPPADAPPAAAAAARGRVTSTVLGDPNAGFLRGMTVSCPRDGRIWGTSAMVRTLETLKPLGVDWVTVHPYGWVRRDGSVRFRPADEVPWMQGAIDHVRASGMGLFWKPHLGYWGSFEWRGTIEFDDERTWQYFFDQYTAWIVDQAKLAARNDVPLFSVGLEYTKTLHREDDWRRVIAAVRAVYPGLLTYSAHWEYLDQIAWWDALDWIGVQYYVPLVDYHDRRLPDRDTIRAAWAAPMAKLERMSKAHGGKPVVLTEIGYDLGPEAAREPWRVASRDNAANRALRRRLMEVAIEETADRSWLRGMFWWKWIPQRRGSRDFAMEDRDARAVLQQGWGRAAAADAGR